MSLVSDLTKFRGLFCWKWNCGEKLFFPRWGERTQLHLAFCLFAKNTLWRCCRFGLKYERFCVCSGRCSYCHAGAIPNNRVPLPKWHQPLGKGEAAKPTNCQVIVWKNGLPCCLVLFTEGCAFPRLTRWTKAHLEGLSLPRLLLLLQPWICCCHKTVCWQQEGWRRCQC